MRRVALNLRSPGRLAENQNLPCYSVFPHWIPFNREPDGVVNPYLSLYQQESAYVR